jgi:hypothetical protein
MVMGSEIEAAAGASDPATPEETAEKDAAEKRHLGPNLDRPNTGDAKTFAEYDQFADARDVENAVDDEMEVFNALIDNVRFDFQMDAGEKAAAMMALSAELPGRIDAARVSGTVPSHAHSGGGGGGAVDTSIGSAKDDGSRAVTNDPGSVSVFKDTTGAWRWMAVHSNRYQDRDHELFTESAHKDWTDFVNEHDAYPPLRLWHVPVDFGRADFVDYDDRGFVVSSGTFKEGAEDIAQALSERKDLGCSHGFRFDRRDRDAAGVYHQYKTFEISVLPSRSAANQLTAFSAGREFPMMNEERKAFLLEVAGPERTGQLDEAVEAMSAFAKEKGITFKSLVDEQFPDLSGVKGVGEGSGDEAPAETPAAADAAAAPAADATPAADAAPAADADAEAEAGDGEEGGGTPSIPTPDAEDVADAEKTFDAAMGGENDPVVVMARALAPAIREAAKEAMEIATEPLVAQLGKLGEEIEGLKALAPVVEGLTASRDELIAAAIRPRTAPGPVGFAAASSPETVVDTEAAAIVAAQKAAGSGENPDATATQRAASPYVDDALAAMQRMPGAEAAG